MKASFDSFGRFEAPKFYLCNPGCIYKDGTLSNVIGAVPVTNDEESVINFNEMSEINLRIPKISYDDPDEDAYAAKIYNCVQNRRLIFIDDIGFFVITSANDEFDGNLQYKDVKAESCEREIMNKELTYIEDGTYKFNDLFEKIVGTLPLWTIGHVDSSVAEKCRTFEDVDIEQNVWAFMIGKMQESYECIFECDCVHRVINVYDQNNYVRLTGIHLTRDDVIRHLTITENSDDLYTAIRVHGNEDLNITPVNPLGSNTIYNFDYYLSWMSDHLREKVISWRDSVKAQTEEYYNLNLSYYEYLTEKHNLQLEADRLNTQLTMYSRCRENIVAEGSTKNVDSYNEALQECGGDSIDIGSEISDTLAIIDEKIVEVNSKISQAESELTVLQAKIDDLDAKVKAIRESVSIDTYFSESEYAELYNYIFEGSYTDEYITVSDIMTYAEKFGQMKVLYDRALAQLEKGSKPTQEFSMDVENFLFEKEFKAWSDELETGCLINVELDDGDVAALFLSSITVNYDDQSLKLTFGNRFNRFDPKALFDKVLGDVKKSSNSLNYIKDILYPVKNGELDAMQKAIETSRTLTKNAALSATDQTVIIDDTGYTGKKLLDNGEYDPEQIKIVSNSLVFTDDNWETCKTALGKIILGDDLTMYGLNAEVVIGDMIIGRQLNIYDSNGKELLSVVDDRIAAGISNSEQGTSASLEILDGKIAAEVKRATDAEGVLSSKISTTADEINLEVTKKVGNDEVISRINQSAEQITISASKINIDGILTVGNLTGSTTTIINNVVTTGFINALSVKAGSVDAEDITGTTISGKTLTGNIINNGSGTFYVDADGNVMANALTATNAKVGGEITATSGVIGGCSIVDGKLQIPAANISTTLTIGQLPSTVAQTDDIPTNVSELINDSGYKTETGVTQIIDGYVTTDFINALAIKAGSVDAENITGTVISGKTISGGSITIGDNFEVSNSGALKCSSAVINGVLAAGEGSSLGEFQVDNNSIFSGSWDVSNDSAPDVFMCTGCNYSYTIGGRYGNNWVFGAGSNFGVTKNGVVYCNTLYANGGSIGPWYINGNGLYSGTNTSLGVRIYSHSLETASSGSWRSIQWRYIHDCAAEWYDNASSDINVKNSISTMDAYDTMFDNLKPCRYKYDYGTSDRYHTGFIAQEVVEAIESAGLTTQDFAGVVHLEEPNENGSEWLLRRDEFVALNTWQIQKLKARVTELEAKLAAIEQ